MSGPLRLAGAASARRLRLGGNAPNTPAGVIVADEFDRVATLNYNNTIDGSADPFFLVEPGDRDVVINNGVMSITKPSNDGYARLYSQIRYGGPGKAVTYRYRAQITQYHDDGGWSGYRGLKFGMKFPSANSSYDKDDPRSVATTPQPGGGNYTLGQPAAYILVDGMTDIGHYELARLGYDTTGYLGFPNTNAPPNAGMFPANTFIDKSMEIAWIGSDDVRFRCWDNFDATGTPKWEYTDVSAVAADAGYLWARIDWVSVQLARFHVEERVL